MQFRDELPDDCPPEGHEIIDAERWVYRLVRGDTPQAEDIRNSYEEYPNREWKRVSPCHVRAVSVWATPDGCRSVHRRGPLRVARLALRAGSGAIMPYGRPGHLSWWPSLEFDISTSAEIVVRGEG